MTAIPDHIFRGYDIRGVAGKDLNEEVMSVLGQGYGTYIAQRRIKHAVVGGGCRLTTPAYQAAFIKGLTSTGVNVIDLGLGLSQTMYFSQYHYKTNGGATITASHNPKNYNGCKLALGYSSTLGTEEIIELKNLIKTGKFVSGKGTVTEDRSWVEAYYSDLLKRVNITKQFKVVVDSVSGSTGPFLPTILRRAGVEVIEQNTTPDGNFPNGTPDPTEEGVLANLARRVLAEKADMGFAYDEDGDRLGIVDGNGKPIWNDVLVALFAKDIIKYLPGATIVYNTLCSKLVTDVIRTAGGTPFMWKTGHSFIKAKLKEVRAPFGGELSGHFFFTDNFYGHDDGAFTSLRLLEFLCSEDRSLAEILDSLPQYISSPEIKLGCSDAIKWQTIDELSKVIQSKHPDAEFVTIDGIRADKPEWMEIIRASQNGPYITVKFEGNTQEQYEGRRVELLQILKANPNVDFNDGVNLKALVG